MSLDVLNAIKRITNKYHPALAETGCNIGGVFASNETGPAVKLHGVAALATIQAVSAKRRPNCEHDAEITIDASEWNALSPQQQDALIHHELGHLKRKEHSAKKLDKLRKENPDCPAWQIDNLGRPKLGTVPADFSPGDAFHSTIAIFGPAAIEFVGAKKFADFARDAMAEYERNKGAQTEGEYAKQPE